MEKPDIQKSRVLIYAFNKALFDSGDVDSFLSRDNPKSRYAASILANIESINRSDSQLANSLNQYAFLKQNGPGYPLSALFPSASQGADELEEIEFNAYMHKVLSTGYEIFDRSKLYAIDLQNLSTLNLKQVHASLYENQEFKLRKFKDQLAVDNSDLYKMLFNEQDQQFYEDLKDIRNHYGHEDPEAPLDLRNLVMRHNNMNPLDYFRGISQSYLRRTENVFNFLLEQRGLYDVGEHPITQVYNQFLRENKDYLKKNPEDIKQIISDIKDTRDSFEKKFDESMKKYRKK